jgi:hypothetical protein
LGRHFVESWNPTFSANTFIGQTGMSLFGPMGPKSEISYISTFLTFSANTTNWYVTFRTQTQTVLKRMNSWTQCSPLPFVVKSILCFT